MADDRGVADHLHRHFGKLKRLDRRFPSHDSLYELGLVLKSGVGMAVAQLWQSYRLKLRLVLFQPVGLQLLDRLFYRRLILGIGQHRPGKGRCPEGNTPTAVLKFPQSAYSVALQS